VDGQIGPCLINNHLIEHSIAGLAAQLRGDLIDVGCGSNRIAGISDMSRG